MSISCPPHTIDSPQSMNSFHQGSEHYTAMKCIVLFLNRVLHGLSLQSVLVYNFTNKNIMSHRSDILASSCRVNVEEPAHCFTVSLISAVSRGGLPSLQFLLTMLDSKSLNTSLLEVIISSKNQPGCIRVLSDLTLQIIFNAWWASMNVGSKWPIGGNIPRHVPSWWVYLPCPIEETGSPGIIVIVCHQVLCHPSEHGTNSLGKHLLATAHIAKQNKLTESEVTEWTCSTVDETALAMLTRQGSRGITIVSSQRKIICKIQVDSYWLKGATKCTKLAAKDFKTFKFDQTRGIATSC